MACLPTFTRINCSYYTSRNAERNKTKGVAKLIHPVSMEICWPSLSFLVVLQQLQVTQLFNHGTHNLPKKQRRNKQKQIFVGKTHVFARTRISNAQSSSRKNQGFLFCIPTFWDKISSASSWEVKFSSSNVLQILNGDFLNLIG